ncbi:MAG: HK97 gp10 family phage protein [Lachnospiraceae bacterium]|nr:HK97 gp10 family phage protein [Lachnospiraceae bacterium]
MTDEIKGMDRLLKLLDEIGSINISEGVRKATVAVQGYAKANCPEDTAQLVNSIQCMYQDNPHAGEYTGITYTNLPYAGFVEFGTGPRGQEAHAGISPNVTVSYTQKSWWIHESQIDLHTAERYKWFYINTPEGKFYLCTGQPAHPYMYPALKDHEDEVVDIISKSIEEQIRRMGH